MKLSLLPILFLAGTANAQPQLETGTLGAAPYRIEVPADWNGELVVYTHGYELTDGKPFPFEATYQKRIRDGFVSRGFAYLQSGYAKEGWAVKEGLEDTEALRRHFVAAHGEPKKTWITGHSMGGLIATVALERQPDVYAGGLALCPALAPAAEFFEENLFDLLAAFDFLAGRAAGIAPLTDSKWALASAEATAAALAKNPAAARILAGRFALRADDLPWLLAFYQPIWKELVERAGGIPVDNRNTLYAGFGDDPAMNRGVARVAGDPAAERYLQQYASPTGRLSDPLVVLHTTYDPIVPPVVASRYDQLATAEGNRDRVRYRFVEADGHCNFTSEETQKAFDLLRDWAASGKAPPAGEL